jgi:translation initiation factor 6
MGTAKMALYGNDFIGAFAVSNDSFTIVGGQPKQSSLEIISKNLETKVVETLVNGSDLIGLYSVINSKNLILPEMAYKSEYDRLKKELPELNISIFETDLNAIRNNILANDRVAVINPQYSQQEARRIGEMLGVEVVKMSIGGYETVGANNILTNKGIVLNNEVSEDEESLLKDLFKNVSQSTANLGSLSIGLCTIANSHGVVAGHETTGYELANIEEGLLF